MIFQYKTKTINGLKYLVESRLISKKGSPSKPLQFSRPFTEDLSDENRKLQWTIRENPNYKPEKDHIDDRYIIEHNPISPTTEELEGKRQQKIRDQFQTELVDLILQNKDNPQGLAQALCNRAKQIEVETKK